ncbi:Cleavage stimulation factor subunit 2 [Chamberlinius hualienensis]
MSGSFFTADGSYGGSGNTDKAPEAISKAVASLPPEQMFELMKQMKLCIQNNPTEARNMLLQNPQLAYALLQAQVVMNIVEPQVALTILNRPNISSTPAVLNLKVETPAPTPPPAVVNVPPKPSSMTLPEQIIRGSAVPIIAGGGGSGIRPSLPSQSEFNKGPSNGSTAPQFSDPRIQQQVEPRDPRNNVLIDPRIGSNVRPPPLMRPPMMMPPQMRDPREMNRDPRGMPQEMDMRPPPIMHFEPRLAMRGMDPRNIRGPPEFDQRPPMIPPMMRPRFQDRGNIDQRSPIYDQRDPRNQAIPHQGQPPPIRQMGPPRAGMPPIPNPPSSQPGGAQEQEKAALIMQVLQLSDQQIAMLPPEQRQSIMVLKEQIARSAEGQK